MRRAFLLLSIFVISLALVSCGGNSAVNGNGANANGVQLRSFADITDPAAALAEGNKLLDENDTENAIEAYKRAVELDPDLGEAYFKMGVAYSLLEAEAKHSGTSERLPGDPIPKEEAKEKANSVKMFEKAVEALKKKVAASPEDAASFYTLGRAYNKLNKDKESEDALEKAVKLNPDDSDYQTELGAIRIKLAKYHEAISALKKAVELDADNVEAAELLEDAQAGAKRVDYVSKPDNTKSNSNANANANVENANSATPANSKTTPSNTKPAGPGDRPRVVKDDKTPASKRHE
ncbi:MAG: serine/threonine protein kinase [Acidobacteria bacterium OLB17]|nr:MAG: serine/threonine protein kinase [Acidobacteria bacterium OLB17]MCZ2390489.1 tetratricopeptide repeat protein [Acidobacteriota bacterium]